MKILIAGATGLIGQALVSALLPQAQIAVLGRNSSRLSKHFPSCEALTWQQLDSFPFDACDVVINLCGENIGSRRWSKKRKKAIFQSRVDTTARLAAACAALGAKAPVFLNASAVGIYGAGADGVDEATPLPPEGADFLSQVGRRWELALEPAVAGGCRVITLRFGVVLSERGGMLKKLLPSFKMGMGAKLGDGQQVISWVSVTDVVRAILFLLRSTEARGAYNIVADEPITQHEFAISLAKHLHRPCWVRLPEWLITLLFGQMGDDLLLQGRPVRASRLKEAGFSFRSKTLDSYWETR